MEPSFSSFVALLLKEVLLRDSAPFRQALLAPDPDTGIDIGVDPRDEELIHLVRSCCPGDVDKASVEGVPVYPLYKQLAANMCRSLDESVHGGSRTALFGDSEDERDKRRACNALLTKHLTPLAEAFSNVRYRLHVQDRFLSQLQDGSKRVEGRCATGFYPRIRPGDYLLFNDFLIMETKEVRPYKSFHQLLETEGLNYVLPGFQSLEEGVSVYRGFYSMETEALGVLALHVSQPVQPCNHIAALLESLQTDGITSLLGLRVTKGTVLSALPPPRCLLLSSFQVKNAEGIASSKLTVGGRALAKHVHRSSFGWWGTCGGTEIAKNKLALKVACRIIEQATWMNIHNLPHSTHIFEIRVKDGYGARWSSDGKQFRGFVEPPMEDGHSSKWRH